MKRDVKGLIKALGYSDKQSISILAARALGEIGDPLSVEPLIVAALQHEDGQTRLAAVEALGRIGDGRAVEALVATFLDKENLVYQAAMEALRQIDPNWRKSQAARRIVPLAIGALQDRDYRVKGNAVQMLGELGDAHAVEPLITILTSTIEIGDVRCAAAQALGKIGDVRAHRPLMAALEDQNKEVQTAARLALVRMRRPWWLRQDPHSSVLSLFNFISGSISIGLMALLTLITGSPFIFPSLGPTAFLFFYMPEAPVASPRNTIIGHLIGVVAGYLSLVVTGLTGAGAALSVGMTVPRVIAVALSLGLTAGLLVWLKVPHPPAGATTLMVSLGILRLPWQLVFIMIAVVLLTAQAVIINRLAGISYPLWSAFPRQSVEGSRRSSSWIGVKRL